MLSKIKPQHYKSENGVEVIDLIDDLDFCTGNVIKYVYRAGKKQGEKPMDDLLKAKYYLERLIAKADR